MPKKFLQSWLPSPQKISQSRMMKLLGHSASNPTIWYINRRSVSRAVLIGVFWGLMPIPFHSLMIVVLIVLFKGNLPIGLLLSWLTNPLTIVPIIYGGFWIGTRLYHVQMIDQKMLKGVFHQIEHWVTSLGQTHIDLSLAKILLSGLLVGCTVLSLLAYVLTLLVWRLSVIRRWRKRHKPNVISS